MERRRFVPLAGLVSLGLSGCAGTSPNLNSPQMQTPSLGGGNSASSRSSAGLRKGAAAEATLPAA
ncbi:MAG: hypothetical protein ACOVT5_15365, partial [Armatimonadaceae bacterium]